MCYLARMWGGELLLAQIMLHVLHTASKKRDWFESHYIEHLYYQNKLPRVRNTQVITLVIIFKEKSFLKHAT